MTRVIRQSPDASNHRTPSKYRTEIQVIPTSIYISGSCRRRAHLPLQGTPIYCIRASIVARDTPAFLLTSSLRCFFQALRSANPLRTCVWQQIQVSKRLVPAPPFTCYTFHGFATRLSGCIIIFLKDFLLVQLSLRLHGLSTRLCSRRKSAVRT